MAVLPTTCRFLSGWTFPYSIPSKSVLGISIFSFNLCNMPPPPPNPSNPPAFDNLITRVIIIFGEEYNLTKSSLRLSSISRHFWYFSQNTGSQIPSIYMRLWVLMAANMTKILYAVLVSPTHTNPPPPTSYNNHNIWGRVNIIELLITQFSPVTSTIFGQYIPLRTLPSNTLNLCSSSLKRPSLAPIQTSCY